MKLPTQQCGSCPFLSNGLPLSAFRMSQIYGYLLQGTNHLCHSDRSNNTICLGGRNWTLDKWYQIGLIKQPTNQALLEEMRLHGIEAADHIVE